MKIKGCGKYVPDYVLTNDDLSKMVDTSDEWIRTRTGIKNRHISRDTKASEMAKFASLKAIENANIDKEDIDMIIVATSTADEIIPSVSCSLHGLLDIKKDIMCFDLTAACTGFIYALDVADKYLGNEVKNILVVGVEKMSKVIDYTDRNTCILFGDGAGAVIVTNDDSKKYQSVMKASGEKRESLLLPGLNEREKSTIDMNGKEIFNFAVKVIPELVSDLIEKVSVEINEIKYIIPHQANYRIIEAAAKKLNIDSEKFYLNLSEYGNTSAASVAIALCEIYEENLVAKGDKIILVGFGGGLTWGAIYIEL